MAAGNDVTIARRHTSGRWFDALIDDVRLYDRELTADEVKALATPPRAYAPVPADGSVHPETWVNLQWSAGADAVSHDVYFGESFDDVAAGTGDTFLGNQTVTVLTLGFVGFPYPDGLVNGTTYYWRIDEVKADGTIQAGDVWSFSVPALVATSPSPADGTKFVDPNLTLSWTGGHIAILHYMYFGENFDDVNSGTAPLLLADTTYTPGPLEFDKDYYWRVDEFDGTTTHRGDVWSFRTRLSIPVTDPNLVCYWMLEEGSGDIVLDWSGHGHDGTVIGNPEWVDGYDGSALHFMAELDYVLHSLGAASEWPAGTVTAWVRADSVGQDVWSSVFSSHLPNSAGFQIDVDGDDPGLYRFQPGALIFGTVSTNWVHLAVAWNGTSARLYYNGSWTSSGTVTATDTTFNQFALCLNRNAENSLFGIIDDFRAYDKMLTQAEIKQVMRIDPLLAWDPRPVDGSTPDIANATPLTWSPGDNAAQHDVYFGIDRDAVADANTSTADIYRGRQNATSYTPPEGVEWGGGPYYWRIDEFNTDATISKGRIWSFTVGDFIVVDDFEIYDINNPIWENWLDGIGFGSPGTAGYYPGNGTGSAAGDDTVASTVEEIIIHGGSQSMPILYDNNRPDKLKYSEVKLTLSSTRDWARHATEALSLWFRGYLASFSTFTEEPPGTFTMTARSGDIWGQSDQLHYVFKQLSGAGSITAKVESISNTNAGAKGGVMIRETLTPDSKHAFTFMRPDGGVRFNRRIDVGADTVNSVENGLAFPHWVKLERQLGGAFTAYHSSDGINFVPVDDQSMGSSDTIQMNGDVFIGLALSSNNTGATCQAVFSDVQVTGSVTGQWQSQDIGILSNNPEPMYVAVADSTGTPAVVYHEDPNATATDTWTEWNIDMQEFLNQGVNLSDVNSIAIGFGDRNNPQPGGSGTMYFDDIRLYQPRCVSSLLKPVASFNDDCIVDLRDLEILASDWLASGYEFAAEAVSDANIEALYEFEGNLLDSSGNLYHGDPCGTIAYAAGMIGQAIDFDGASWVNVSGYQGVAGTQSRTCAAWIKTADLGEILAWGQNVAGQKWIFRVQETNGILGAIRMEVNSGYIVGSIDLRDGQWHHVAAVLVDDGSPDVNEIELYVDGILEAVSASEGEPINTAADGDVRIGQAAWGARPFTGQIDDVRIYRRVVSQAEIANLAGNDAGAVLRQPVQAFLSTTADTDLNDDEKIDFKDFAVMADMWLGELLWPAP
jgi:hypothetical protein